MPEISFEIRGRKVTVSGCPTLENVIDASTMMNRLLSGRPVNEETPVARLTIRIVEAYSWFSVLLGKEDFLSLFGAKDYPSTLSMPVTEAKTIIEPYERFVKPVYGKIIESLNESIADL